jgi:PKD repeat protein
VDEPQKIENDPTDASAGYPHGRTDFLWPVYLSGGGGFEWYVQEDGGGHSFDQRVDDLNELAPALDWTGHALAFLASVRFWEMEPAPALADASSGGPVQVLADAGTAYAVYAGDGGSLTLDLSGHPGTFEVTWFDPRSGAWQAGGSVPGGAPVGLGASPFGGDAAVRVVRAGAALPVAAFESTPQGTNGTRFAFDAAPSFDDGTLVSHRWDFGDGSTAAGETATHQFLPGLWWVTLTVTDDSGTTARRVQPVFVAGEGGGSDPSGVTLVPVEDAYVEGTAGFDNGLLKVESGSRTSYLKFQVDSLPSGLTGATLRLRQSTDPSSGVTLELFTSSDHTWSETTLEAATAPLAESQVASFQGPVPSGSEVAFDLDPALFSSEGSYTFVLSSPAGNDVWFGSSESGLSPELELVGSGTCTPVAETCNGADDDCDGTIDEGLSCECSDALDNDGDGLIDFPADPGCAFPSSDVEAPACDDGIDNEGDGKTDYPEDDECPSPSWGTERRVQCGLGPELALALPLLLAWRCRRRRATTT